MIDEELLADGGSVRAFLHDLMAVNTDAPFLRYNFALIARSGTKARPAVFTRNQFQSLARIADSVSWRSP